MLFETTICWGSVCLVMVVHQWLSENLSIDKGLYFYAATLPVIKRQMLALDGLKKKRLRSLVRHNRVAPFVYSFTWNMLKKECSFSTVFDRFGPHSHQSGDRRPIFISSPGVLGLLFYSSWLGIDC